MSNFKFNEKDMMVTASSRQNKKANSSLTQKLILWGLAKNESQASLYLVAVVVIVLGLIVYINIQTFSTPPQTTIDDEELLKM